MAKLKRRSHVDIADNPDIIKAGYNDYDEDEKKVIEEVRKVKAEMREHDAEKSAKLFSINNFTKEINGYGFNYSMKDFVSKMLVICGTMIGAGIFYKLEVWFIIALVVFMGFLIPKIMKAQFKYVYEQKKFDDATSYMEQMIYAFKKRPKILAALQETLTTADGRMAEVITDAINYIQEGVCEQNLYEEAFKIIEDEYYCTRIKALHSFMAKIEESGGTYDNSINILLYDIQSWSERVYIFQKERKNIKVRIALSLVLSLVICGLTLAMLPSEFSITNVFVYQITTTALIAVFMIIYTITQSKLNGSWLQTPITKKEVESLKRDYKTVATYNVKAATNKTIPVTVVGLVIAIVLLLLKQNVYAAIVGVVAFMIYRQPKAKKKGAKKRVEREIEKEFPSWLRDIAISLQSRTVHVAIKESVPKASVILQPALNQLLIDFNDNPTGIEPYMDFMSEFNLPDIKSAMKMLHSLNNTGREDSEKQINAMIERNNKLVEKSENLKNEDSLAGINFLTTIPMLIASIKLVFDMLLVIIQFMTVLQVTV